MDINWDDVNSDVEELSLKGRVITGKVVSVYDGDSCRVVFPVLRKLYKFNCRIKGVDTPELRTKNKKEKAYGLLVRDKLKEKILNKVVWIECSDFDKYGRLLIDIKNPLLEGEKISEWLINNKYAMKYNGGTKNDWGEYIKQNKLI